MLKEKDRVSQHEGEKRRRWFYCTRMDLVVWVEDNGAPYGFQLSYEATKVERKLLTWLPGRGYSHDRLDEGEGRPFRYKMTPVAVSDGVFDQPRVLEWFLEESKEIDPTVREFVVEKLTQYKG